MATITGKIISPQKIREIIIEATENRAIVENLDDDDELLSDASALDSVDLVSVIVLTERSFNVDFSQEPDITKVFKSINSIIAGLEARIAQEHEQQ